MPEHPCALYGHVQGPAKSGDFFVTATLLNIPFYIVISKKIKFRLQLARNSEARGSYIK